MTRTLVLVIDATDFGKPGRAVRAFYKNGAKLLDDESYGDELARLASKPGSVDAFVAATELPRFKELGADYRWALAECDDVVVVRCWGDGYGDDGATIHRLVGVQ